MTAMAKSPRKSRKKKTRRRMRMRRKRKRKKKRKKKSRTTMMKLNLSTGMNLTGSLTTRSSMALSKVSLMQLREELQLPEASVEILTITCKKMSSEL